MPELPEIETIRRSLEKEIVGKKIKNIKILEPKQFHGSIEQAEETLIKQIGRKGKVLFIELSNHKYLNFHLKMSGEILFAKDGKNAVLRGIIPRSNTNKLPNQHTRIIIEFSDDSALFFNDLRMFGWVKLTDKPEVPSGPDVMSPEFTRESLKKIASSTNKPIKALLLEQDKLAGVGNIYANDSLWEAKINPQRKAKSLTDDDIIYLYNAIKKIIAEGIKYKGSSAKDEMYILPDGEKGQYQDHFKVYHQQGKPCKRDGVIIKDIRIGGRGTFYCPKCQV